MRSRRGIFWYSLGLTLLLLLPMVLTVAFFTDQYQKQQLLRQASAAEDSLRVEPGAQDVFRLLLVVQQDKPAFVLARVDGPQQAVTLCALPGSLLVDAPAGRTTLAECALSAGRPRRPAAWEHRCHRGERRAALAYLAATPATWWSVSAAAPLCGLTPPPCFPPQRGRHSATAVTLWQTAPPHRPGCLLKGCRGC